MSSRTYLSIGDVLTLLRREFPDVTISKIRFLESQGLVNPERTPSGYRKFYEPDVERLRWVLRQQREHFLPLKVIKGRLEEETPSEGGNGHETRRSDHPSAGSVARSARTRASSEERVSAVLIDDRSETSSREDSGRLRSASAEKAPTAVPFDATRGLGLTEPGPEAKAAPATEEAVPFVRDAEARLPSTRSGGGGEPKAPTGAERSLPVGSTTGEPGREQEEAAAAAGTSPLGVFSGTSMTEEELASASGLEPREVRDLESFGLLSGRTIGGVTYFDEGALVVGRLAAAFARYGVEARHLRLHLLAAQREAGFIEQVVLPLLKQRNPSSRQRAHETVSELSRLGQELRAALLETRLREQLGG